MKKFKIKKRLDKYEDYSQFNSRTFKLEYQILKDVYNMKIEDESFYFILKNTILFVNLTRDKNTSDIYSMWNYRDAKNKKQIFIDLEKLQQTLIYKNIGKY